MIRYYSYIFILTLFLLCACKPYNSSESNRSLLKGRWLLISQTYNHPDSTQENLLLDTLFLTFTNDSILETINHDFNQMYSYHIKGYDISWKIDSLTVSKTKIVKIKKDTFMMRTFDYLWIYRRVE